MITIGALVVADAKLIAALVVTRNLHTQEDGSWFSDSIVPKWHLHAYLTSNDVALTDIADSEEEACTLLKKHAGKLELTSIDAHVFVRRDDVASIFVDEKTWHGGSISTSKSTWRVQVQLATLRDKNITLRCCSSFEDASKMCYLYYNNITGRTTTAAMDK